jgi:hypothetical protein
MQAQLAQDMKTSPANKHGDGFRCVALSGWYCTVHSLWSRTTGAAVPLWSGQADERSRPDNARILHTSTPVLFLCTPLHPFHRAARQTQFAR